MQTTKHNQTTVTPVTVRESIVNLPLDKIHRNTGQPRKNFDEEKLFGLAKSIDQMGLLQPIIVRPNPDQPETYVIIAGERRYRAHCLLGGKTIDCIVKDASVEQSEIVALIENVQRVNLSYVERAACVAQMLRTRDHQFVAQKIGKSRDWVHRAELVHYRLPDVGKQMLEAGRLTVDAAIRISRIALKEHRASAIAKITGDRLNNRESLAFLHANYQTDLTRAPFPVDDDKLLLGAPSCATCPNRVGNCRALFSLNGDEEIPDDTCVDPLCFGKKAQADWERRVKKAVAAGLTVLTREESQREWMPGKEFLKSTSFYVDLDAPCEFQTGGVRWRNVLGTAEAARIKKYLSRSLINTCHVLVKKNDLTAALQRSGSPLAEKIGAKVDQQIVQSRKNKLDEEVGRLVKSTVEQQLRAKLGGGKLRRFCLTAIAAQLPQVTVQPVLKKSGILPGDAEQTARAIVNAPEHNIEEALKELAITLHCSPDSAAIKACGGFYEIDLPQIKADACSIVRSRHKKSPATKRATN
ncbi:MAG: ParB/RepB/Spo0J family partition protein [Verrucomicrobiales bacterium]|jgi:ParB/RepB/Spo0J family partition protein|nr:ParB/RepB/Spo0J family partition protein [Verrucomicrobiales bacterium]